MATVVEEYTALEKEQLAPPSPPAKLTLEQANKLAAGRPFELIDGRMVFKMADYDHARAQSKLSKALGNYFEKGSREVWLVDSYEKGIMVVTPTSKHWVWDTLASELLPGFQLEVKNIFARPVAPAAAK